VIGVDHAGRDLLRTNCVRGQFVAGHCHIGDLCRARSPCSQLIPADGATGNLGTSYRAIGQMAA
jgi:hypothetical protein